MNAAALVELMVINKNVEILLKDDAQYRLCTSLCT